jgi:hypothetical protein
MHRISLERHLDMRRYKRECKEYAAKLAELTRLGLYSGATTTAGGTVPASSQSSRTSTLAPATPSRASSTAQVPPAPPSAVPIVLRKKTRTPGAPLKPEKAKAKAKAKSEGFVDAPVYDMDNFQNPQVASHTPLDMDRPWSM